MKRLLLCLAFTCVFVFNVQAQTIVFGNPSDAITDTNQPDNYLVYHDNFILSYNRSRGAANWVTWHLSASDMGPVRRLDNFIPDGKLPPSWRILRGVYSGSGFDRGHMCPSEDRTSTREANDETFLMSNMQPQTGRLNGGPWKSLETYTQKAVREQGMEAYVYAGCYGDKGRLKDKVTVPTNCWKIVVLLPEGGSDLRRADRNTRVIAVNMPNTTDAASGWRNHRVSVDDLEDALGYDFLSTVTNEIETVIEGRKDNY